MLSKYLFFGWMALEFDWKGKILPHTDIRLLIKCESLKQKQHKSSHHKEKRCLFGIFIACKFPFPYPPPPPPHTYLPLPQIAKLFTRADPERGGPSLTRFFFFFFFVVNQGKEDQNTTESGPSLARQRANDGPTLNAGLVFLGIRAII